MSINEDELVDAYEKADPSERFKLIYENYSVFPQIVDCFEIGLFNTILNEKEYNRRARNSADLGVRVQTSNKSDPTAKVAVERVMIREAIQKCEFVKYEEGVAMFSMGIHSFMDLAKEAKAVYRIRRIVLVNTEIIEDYLENFRDL